MTEQEMIAIVMKMADEALRDDDEQVKEQPVVESINTNNTELEFNSDLEDNLEEDDIDLFDNIDTSAEVKEEQKPQVIKESDFCTTETQATQNCQRFKVLSDDGENIKYESGGVIVNFKRKSRDEMGESDFFSQTPDEKFNTVDEALHSVMETYESDEDTDDFLNNCMPDILEKLRPYLNTDVNRYRGSAYNNPDTDRHICDDTMFKKDEVNVGGKGVRITRVRETPTWSLDLQECMTNNDRARNFDQLRLKVTVEFINYFGGFKNIKSIYVNSLQLYINDVCYTPLLSDTLMARLPFDSADYIREGCYAPFFNWGYLQKMSNLSVLSFDDADFVTTYVADDLGFGRGFKALKLFNICRNLSILCIESDKITYPLQADDIEAVEKVERKTNYSQAINDKCDKYMNKSLSVTKGLRQWQWNNLKTYAQNRGNKGWLQYLGGCTTRFVGGVIFSAPEAATRVGTGLFNAARAIIRDTLEHGKNIE